MLLKMLNQGIFEEINGCISTGKEANVYHAHTAAGADLAVKARFGGGRRPCRAAQRGPCVVICGAPEKDLAGPASG